MENQKELKHLVGRRHPDYDLKKEHWNFLLETYESPRTWFDKHLFRFTREGEKTFEGRRQRAYRFNHTREVVDLVNKYLFKEAPMRSDDVPDYVVDFRKRATLSGLSQLQFETQVSRKASIMGRVYVVVDNDKAANTIISRADEKSGDVRLYAYLVMPTEFLDCGYDKNGEFEWVLIHERERDDDDPFTSTGEIRDRFRLWTKQDWYLFQSEPAGTIKFNSTSTPGIGTVQLVRSGTHGLGVVPVLKCDNIESDNRYSVPALIEDIAYLDRAVANYLSNLDQVINDQTFSQLTMPAQGVLPGVGTTPGDKSDSIENEETAAARAAVRLGTSQILLYDGEHGKAPEYISPDPKQAQLILTTVRQIINEIYHTVGLAGERTKQDNSMGIDNSSGVAKAFDFERVNALLASKANAMQTFANRLERLIRIYHGEIVENIPPAPTVLYSTNFDVRSLNDEVALASNMSLLGVPMELRRYQLSSLVDKLYPMLPSNEKENISKAIAKWEDGLYTSTNSLSGEGTKPKGATTQGFPGEVPDAIRE
jgi:hypothetical protein